MTATPARLAVAVLVGCVVAAPPVGAHEMGSSRGLVTFAPDDTCTIEFVVDPQALMAQVALDDADGAPPPAPADGPAIVDQLRARLPAIAAGIDLRFDGERHAFAIDYTAEVPARLTSNIALGKPADTGLLTLRGRVPAGARGFTLAYRWTYGAMALVVADPRGREPRTVWLGPGDTSPVIALADVVPPTTTEVVTEYLVLGFTHIVPLGIDHILFVLGLFFLSAGWRPLLLQVTSFTVAHTMTLGLTMLGVVSLSPRIVEPLIALSIAYVAVENLTTTRLRRSRLLLIFAFGLLHGMGFAGVLADLGLPASRFVPALLSFNVGVEAGQIAVIAAATLAVAGWRQREASLLPLVARPASVAIALGGLYWTFERVFL